MTIDIRDRFPLGDYRDKVVIYFSTSELVRGCITYKVINGTPFHGLTQIFCKEAGMDDETTLIWVLRYGERLPRHIRELPTHEIQFLKVCYDR